MPKGTKHKGLTRSQRHRIGNRKSGKSADFMTNEELLKVYSKGGKDRIKAYRVMKIRGLSIPEES